MKRLTLALLLLSCQAAPGGSNVSDVQKPQAVRLQVSARVDTARSDVRAVLALYESYLNSRPDSIYDNPHWNTAEKAAYEDFDFSRASIYNGVSSAALFRVYTPFALSVEPHRGQYHIRVLYSNPSAEAPYIGSKVWCIHKLVALREGGEWKLGNYLWEKTAGWQKKQVGLVEYVFPPGHGFNAARAQEAAAFCERIVRRFNPGYDKPFQFYLASGPDEMGELENFDYYFTGITTGKAREGMILTSKGDEHYPHELVHQLLPGNEGRGQAIEEGLATFLGTREDPEAYRSLMQKLAHDHRSRPAYTLENILNGDVEWRGYPAIYPGGALACEAVYNAKGDAGLNQLMRGQSGSYEAIVQLCGEILGLSAAEVEQELKQQLRGYE
ncbi:hypothetical protein [Phaeodactylibacter luteus]|uniref:Uncharacterized protein n=1 Tax=Phaeodactylibacter luteus TaxID=1564516 RepID=A0A5C6RQU2_9BACT|nr:hypothetical protein [Phaeodactylibacter luteus]TXB63752.1 hypothetical protein FRY97_07990 [Phaeodactylibacter luteus]